MRGGWRGKQKRNAIVSKAQRFERARGGGARSDTGRGAKRCADAKNTKPDTHISLIEPER